MDNNLGPVKVKDLGNIESVLKTIPLAVKAATGTSVAFVLDADVGICDRWKAVAGKLSEFFSSLPTDCPADGFCDSVPSLNARVGVWIMPDCVSSFGRLEDLLGGLVPAGDKLFEHAAVATGRAKDMGARFKDVDEPKAVLHAWLAWQSEPGLAYGTAIAARYFESNSTAAQKFVAWFRSVYRL